MKEEQDSTKNIEAPPPFLKSWKNLYRLVIFTLLILIFLFYMLTVTLS